MNRSISMALAEIQSNRFGQAAELLEPLLAAEPDNFDALQLLAAVYSARGEHSKALPLFRQALALDPNFAPTWMNAGNCMTAAGEYEEAISAFRTAIRLRPKYVEAHYNLAQALERKRDLAAAEQSYLATIRTKPDHAAALNNLGVLHLRRNRIDSALKHFNRALAAEPGNACAMSNRALAQFRAGKSEAALQELEACVRIDPFNFEAWSNRGLVLYGLRRIDESIASFRQALSLAPAHAEAHANLGMALNGAGAHRDAIVILDKATALDPGLARVHYERGLALSALLDPHAAIQAFEQAHAAEPDFAPAYANKGLVLKELQRYRDAVFAYDKALALDPELNFAAGERYSVKAKICDWTDDRNERQRLEGAIMSKKQVAPPFVMLAASDRSDIHQAASRIWCENLCGSGQFPTLQPHKRKKRIKIAYLSADFRDHPTSQLTAGLFERHDRNCFETFGLSIGPVTSDAARARIMSAVEHFDDMGHLSDNDIVARCRELEIDILLDLMGYTRFARVGVLAKRAAPVQVNFLGFPGTMGAPFMDYMIVDDTIADGRTRPLFDEKIISMAFSYQPNDTSRPLPDGKLSRAEAGLPEDAVIFCSFNNSYKITRETFSSWLCILKKVEDSVLWLLQDNDEMIANLRAEAQAHGVDANRLVFAPRAPLEAHLKRQSLADLFLDTFPYNAHTTCSDALWAGLPVVTRIGDSFASRVAASLLTTAGFPELIVRTEEEYENLAVRLASDRKQLDRLKQDVVARARTSPLFDAAQFARHLEDGLQQAYERSQAGLPPQDIRIAR